MSKLIIVFIILNVPKQGKRQTRKQVNKSKMIARHCFFLFPLAIVRCMKKPEHDGSRYQIETSLPPRCNSPCRGEGAYPLRSSRVRQREELN